MFLLKYFTTGEEASALLGHYWFWCSLDSNLGDGKLLLQSSQYSIPNPLGWKSLRGFLRKGAGDIVFLFLGSQYFRSMVQAFGWGRHLRWKMVLFILIQCYFTVYFRKRFTPGFLLVTSFNQCCFNSRVRDLNESLMFELFSRNHLWRITVLLSLA